MEYRKEINVKVTMKLSSKAVIIAIAYNLILLLTAILLASNATISQLVSKPFPGIHLKLSIPSIPPDFRDIDIKINSLSSLNILLLALTFIIDVMVTSFFQPLYLSYFIDESFKDDIELDKLPLELVKERFLEFVKYNFIAILLVFISILAILISPILGIIIILTILILLFTWIYTPIILLLEPVGPIEAIRKSMRWVIDNLDEFFKILIISSIAISIIETLFSFFPIELALILALVIWIPVGSMVISLIIDSYSIIRDKNQAT